MYEAVQNIMIQFDGNILLNKVCNKDKKFIVLVLDSVYKIMRHSRINNKYLQKMNTCPNTRMSNLTKSYFKFVYFRMVTLVVIKCIKASVVIED